MRNEAGDIVQDHSDELARECKEKAKAAGAAAWDAARATYQQFQGKSVECSKKADRAIREKPYVAVGVAFGFGMLLGLLALGRKTYDEEEY